MRLFLALDQSTSATKALLFDADGRALDREARDHRQHYPQPGWVEHDAEEIWRNTLAVLAALLTRQTSRLSEIVSLSITNQRETIVVFDRATGNPLHPALVWQDRRGDAICAEHVTAGREALIHRKTGLKIDGYFSASKLQWLVRRRPDLRAKLADGSALIGTIDAYLVFRLTGGSVFATDTTNASRTLLYDITKLAWDDELCALWEVPRRALPEVRDCTAFWGNHAGGVARTTAANLRRDGRFAGFALRPTLLDPGAAKVTFGTGSSLLLNIGNQPRFSAKGVLTALAWTHDDEPTYALEGIVISSASTLTWLRDQVGLAPDVASIEKLAMSVPDTGGVYLVPAFTGLGLPHWNSTARATITGLSPHSGRRHIARAAFESIAFQISDALETMRTEAAVPIKAIHGDGGATASRFLMQLCADIAGTDLHVAKMADCSAYGAAIAGQLGLGMHRSLSAIEAISRPETVYRATLADDRLKGMRSERSHSVQAALR